MNSVYISDHDHDYIGHSTDPHGNKFLVYKLKSGYRQRSQYASHINYDKPRLYDHAVNHRTKLGIQVSSHEIITMGFCHGRLNNYGVFVHHYEKQPDDSLKMAKSCIPKDKDVLNRLQLECLLSGTSKAQFMRGFIKNYNHTSAHVNPFKSWTFSHLDSMAKHYYPAYPQASITQAYLNLAMTAEYHYRNPKTHHYSILNKKVKAIGVCQAILDNKDPIHVATYSKGKSVHQLNKVYRYYMDDRLPRLLDKNHQKHKIRKVIQSHPLHNIPQNGYELGFHVGSRNYNPSSLKTVHEIRHRRLHSKHVKFLLKHRISRGI